MEILHLNQLLLLTKESLSLKYLLKQQHVKASVTVHSVEKFNACIYDWLSVAKQFTIPPHCFKVYLWHHNSALELGIITGLKVAFTWG